jgi:hypothetical protein
LKFSVGEDVNSSPLMHEESRRTTLIREIIGSFFTGQDGIGVKHEAEAETE